MGLPTKVHVVEVGFATSVHPLVIEVLADTTDDWVSASKSPIGVPPVNPCEVTEDSAALGTGVQFVFVGFATLVQAMLEVPARHE